MKLVSMLSWMGVFGVGVINAGCALHVDGSSAPSSTGSSDGGTSSNTPSDTNSTDPHPSWVVGTYEDPGKIENNIASGQRTIHFAADGSYSGNYCNSCGNEGGKWSVSAGKLVLEGGSFAGTITLASDLTPNCRILSYVNTRFYRSDVVPSCPFKGAQADEAACAVVGNYQVNGTGDVSDSVLVSVEPDFFWYRESTHLYCVANKYGSKCLNTTLYDFGSWSFRDGQPAGAPIDELTFTSQDCTTYGAASSDGTAGASGGGSSSGGSSSGGSSAGSSSAGASSGGASSAGSSSGGSSSAGVSSGGSSSAGASSGSSAGASSGGSSSGGSKAGGTAGSSSGRGGTGSGGGSAGGGASGAGGA
jgi:hypothetical protein